MVPTKRCSKVRNKLLRGIVDDVSENVTADDVRNEAVLSQLSAGGVYDPPDCLADNGTAIIIPYRNRPHQLEILVYYLHAILQRQRLRYAIFVVEMAMPAQFNRGMLANAGFLTASSFGKYSCYIIHDVDLLPVNDHNLYTCGKHPRHLLVRSTKYPDELPYPFYIGGVLAMTGTQYAAVNGFSNMFFGWGGEDDDMYWRTQSANMTVTRPKPQVGAYVALHHAKDTANPPNPHRNALLHMWKYRMWIDGLNSVNHQRLALEFRPYYTWMLIQCVESAFFNNFPYITADQKLLQVDETKNSNETQESLPKRENSNKHVRVLKHNKQKKGVIKRSA